MGERDEISPTDPVDTVNGVGPARGESLRENEYTTVRDLQKADASELALVEDIPLRVAKQIKDRVGTTVESKTTATQAKEQAQKIPGAKATVVRTEDGKQKGKVLRKVKEQRTAGSSVTIRKG